MLHGRSSPARMELIQYGKIDGAISDSCEKAEDWKNIRLPGSEYTIAGSKRRDG